MIILNLLGVTNSRAFGFYLGSGKGQLPRACKYIYDLHYMLVNLVFGVTLSEIASPTSGVSFVFDYLVVGDVRLRPG